MKKKKSGIGGFFKEFGEAVVKGDLFVNYPWSGWEQDISAENKLSKVF